MTGWGAGLRPALGRVLGWIPRVSMVLGFLYGGLWYLSPLRFGDYLRNPRTTDFALYYREARVAIEYGWSHMYDLDAYERVTREVMPVTHDNPTLLGLTIPLLTWLVAPFATLPLPLAYALWLVLMAACLAAVFWLLAPHRPPRRLALHAAAWVLFAPLALTFALGQSVALVAAATAGAARLLRSGREWPAGLLLGFALIKPQLVLLLPLCLLAAGRWRAVAAWAAAAAAIAAAVTVIVGPSALPGLAQRVLTVSNTPSRLQVIVDAAPAAALPTLPLKALAGLMVGLLCAGIARLERQRIDRVVAVALVGSLVAAPYLHYQDLLMLALAGWLVLAAEPEPWERWLLGSGYLQAVLAISVLPALELAWLALRLFSGLRRAGAPAPRPLAGPLRGQSSS